jgi:hypothetical protein
MSADEQALFGIDSSMFRAGNPGRDACRLLAGHQTVHFNTNPLFHKLLS